MKLYITFFVAVLLFIGGGCSNTPASSDTDTSAQETAIPSTTDQATDSSATPTYTDNSSLPGEDVEAIGDLPWSMVSDPYLGIDISYPHLLYSFTPANFTADDTNGPRWMILSRINSNNIKRIEIWKLSDMPERPFGIEEEGIDPKKVLPHYREVTAGEETYGVYLFVNGETLFIPEMEAIIDTVVASS